MSKIRVGIFFGGRSAEHEVSLLSARSVYENLNKDKFDIVLIGIDKAGKFYFEQEHLLRSVSNASIDWGKASVSEKSVKQELVPVNINLPTACRQEEQVNSVDVIFPVLHGTYGEDGTIQGLLRSLDVPFVGPDVLGSAVCMDKDVAKRLMTASGIPNARSATVLRSEKDSLDYDNISGRLGKILFIKPANLGSSVGINKAHSEKEFNEAVEEAFRFDNKIIIEEYINGREIECSVLGNEYPKASLPGEIVVKSDFYSYDAKYFDPDAADLKIPADLPENVIGELRDLAVKTFKSLCCEGMARVDFFVDDNNCIMVNEVNTIPGFTKISMYPKLWEATGLSYSDLLEELINLAIERHERDNRLQTAIA